MIWANKNNVNKVTSSVQSTTSMTNNNIEEEQLSMTRKLRRMKRKLLLDYVSEVPANIQYHSQDSFSSSITGSICSSSSDF